MSKDKKILLIPVIFLVLLLGCVFYIQYNQHQPHNFKVSFLDIGQGDATLIQFNNGQKMLVDCGKDKRILTRLGEALPFYDRTIDFLIATHPDLDHYGGCVDVLKNYTVKEIITNGHAKPDSFWDTFEKAMHDEGAVLKTMAQPEVWNIGSSTLEFMSPDKDLVMSLDADDSNNYSIVFRLKNNNENFLFTADMEVPLENALLNKYCSPSSTAVVSSSRAQSRDPLTPSIRDSSTSFHSAQNDSEACPALQSNILKVGHHGSDTSSGEDFLRAVGAKVGIISVGVNNKYGHPSRRVMKKLERAGMEVLRTDLLGSIFED